MLYISIQPDALPHTNEHTYPRITSRTHKHNLSHSTPPTLSLHFTVFCKVFKVRMTGKSALLVQIPVSHRFTYAIEHVIANLSWSNSNYSELNQTKHNFLFKNEKMS